MEKGASTVDLKKTAASGKLPFPVDLKKTAASDDDFGKDFLESWKSAKLGDDTVDFDMETVPRNKNGPFKFDEFDNFELSGNFDKLPSFKLDMPDLDFSSLSKKNEKTQEKSSKEYITAKKDSKEDKFSFDFDFSSFDVATNSPKDKRPENCSVEDAAEYSSKHEKNQNSAYNISTSNNIPRDQPCKTQEAIENRAAIAEDNERATCVTTAHEEYSHEMFLAKEISDKNQDFCLQSSGDGSLEADFPDIQRSTAPLNAVKPSLTMKKYDFLQPINSSASRSSSPVESFNSDCWTKSSGKELQIPRNMLQKQQEHGKLTRISGRIIGSVPNKEDYNSTGPKESIQKVKNIEEKQNSEHNLILPQLKRLQLKNSSSSHETSMSAKKVAKHSFQTLINDATTLGRKVSSADNNAPSLNENAEIKIVAGTRLGSQIIDTKNKGVTLDNIKHHNVRSSAIPETVQVNSNKPNSAIPSGVKSVRFLEKKMEYPLTNLNTIEKNVPLHAPLKRKIDEESVADLDISGPSKCVKESTASRRKSIEASPDTDRKMATEIKVAETYQNVASVENQMSFSAVPAVGNLTFGASSCFEDDVNLQKAETLTRELDNICNMLRKKHEETKELQVLSIINNNALLFLYNPMLEEKIQELQKFATRLLQMEI